MQVWLSLRFSQYYERARGQYNQAKLMGEKSFSLKYPSNQVIDMLALAKCMMLYECRPDLVSRGKQKYINPFSAKIETGDAWTKNKHKYNDYYYKRVVAIAILDRETDTIIKQSAWYKVKKAFKANVVAYTISLLIDAAKRQDMELDYLAIWKKQDIDDAYREQLADMTEKVYDYLVNGPHDIDNISEWCKSERCWERCRAVQWNISADVIDTWLSKEYVDKTFILPANATGKIADEIDAIMTVYNRGVAYWNSVRTWATTRKIPLPSYPIDKACKGTVLTEKEAKALLNQRDTLIKNGMPNEFN